MTAHMVQVLLFLAAIILFLLASWPIPSKVALGWLGMAFFAVALAFPVLFAGG